MTPIVLIYLAWLLIINVVTAVAYRNDKLAAQQGKWRIKEQTLFTLNAVGGVIGAWLVFFGMRHKTKHQSFWIVQSASTVLHLALLVGLVFFVKI